MFLLVLSHLQLGAQKKESLLNHVYVNNFASVAIVDLCVPAFGDHVPVLVGLDTCVRKPDKQIIKRDWSCYSSLHLDDYMRLRLTKSSINWAALSVCDHWNALENIIINCVDDIAPLKCLKPNNSNFEPIPGTVKNKINKLNRLLKSRNTVINAPILRNLNKEIKDHFVSRKVSKVKQAA